MVIPLNDHSTYKKIQSANRPRQMASHACNELWYSRELVTIYAANVEISQVAVQHYTD
jgi:hypothetical protein